MGFKINDVREMKTKYIPAGDNEKRIDISSLDANDRDALAKELHDNRNINKNGNDILEVDEQKALQKLTGDKIDKAALKKLLSGAKTDMFASKASSEVSRLISILENSTNEAEWAEAAETLGDLGDRSAVPALLNALSKANYLPTMEVIIEALGKLKDPSAVPALVKQLTNKDNDNPLGYGVRGWAAWALGEIGDRLAVKALISALNDKSHQSLVTAGLRGSIVMALGKLKDPSAVSALIKALNAEANQGEDDVAAEIRCKIVWALGEIGDPSAVEALEAAKKDVNETVRKLAQEALGKINAKKK